MQYIKDKQEEIPFLKYLSCSIPLFYRHTLIQTSFLRQKLLSIKTCIGKSINEDTNNFVFLFLTKRHKTLFYVFVSNWGTISQAAGVEPQTF